MQIDTCVVSSTADPLYLDFFPLVHRMWGELVGLRCVLMLVAPEIPPGLMPLRDDIVLVPPLQDVEDGFIAQCIRLLAPQLVGARRGVVLSDIDLIPMRRSYYVDAVRDLPDDAMAVYRANALPGYAEIPICFNAAHPATWAELIEPADHIDAAMRILGRWRTEIPAYDPSTLSGWTTDQAILFRCVEAFDRRRLRRFRDQELGFRRLDRSHLDDTGRLTWRQAFLAAGGGYSDCHMPRPMSRFAAANARIAETALSPRRLPTLLVNARAALASQIPRQPGAAR